MGTWDLGPFSNDAAADLVRDAAEGGASRTLTRALRQAAKTSASEYLDVDVGHAAIASAELVAMSFGRGAASDAGEDAVEVSEKLKPSDALRVLAIDALDRVRGSGSEVVELWVEGGKGDDVRAAIADIRSRLVASSAGPVPVFRPKAGEVFIAEFEGHSFAGQVLGPKEVLIFDGPPASDAVVRSLVATASGHRVPCQVARELRSARFLGKSQISKEHKTPKHYVVEYGYVVGYRLVDAATRIVDFVDIGFEGALAREAHEFRSLASLAALSSGRAESPRLRTPDEREAAERDARRAGWVERRKVTGPGPFDDFDFIRSMFERTRGYEAAAALQLMESRAKHGFGGATMGEYHERLDYVHAALVAVWRGSWPLERIPTEVRDVIPPPPKSLRDGVRIAGAIAAEVLRRSAELRMMWEESEDGGEGIRRAVAELRAALA